MTSLCPRFIACRQRKQNNMGLIQSCLGKKSNKIGVMSEEEAEVYGKMEGEMKKEMEDDIIHTKPLPWLMFCTESGITRADTDTGDRSTVSEVVEKRGGMAFTIGYKSTVPKLPPINAKRNHVPKDEDCDKWKEERDKLLLDKLEQAKVRRDNILHERIKSARRPKTVPTRASTEGCLMIE